MSFGFHYVEYLCVSLNLACAVYNFANYRKHGEPYMAAIGTLSLCAAAFCGTMWYLRCL